MKKRRRLAETLWNLWCIGTLVGIWPRFIEPKLLLRSHLKLPLKNLPQKLDGFKVVHFTDLHFSRQVSDRFLGRVVKKINALNADIVVFTGDFMDFSNLEDKERLTQALSNIRSRHGCFATFGNHDYSSYVSIDASGDYNVKPSKRTGIVGGFGRLFNPPTLSKTVTQAARSVPFHEELVDLLKKTPFTLLHNETIQLPIGSASLNLCGLGEYMLGRFSPDEAFQNYDPSLPGIVLAHNPDTLPHLKNYPGDLILCGHTHGGAVNLPGISRRLILLENPQYVHGKFDLGSKTAYVNRGVGSTIPFRWFAPPEILSITLKKGTPS